MGVLVIANLEYLKDEIWKIYMHTMNDLAMNLGENGNIELYKEG